MQIIQLFAVIIHLIREKCRKSKEDVIPYLDDLEDVEAPHIEKTAVIKV
jgi:hypothetical protein